MSGKAYGSNFLQLSQQQSRDPVRGLRVSYIFRGMPAEIQFAANSVNQYASWNIDDSQSPCWQLNVEGPDLSDIQAFFEVAGQELNRSVYEHPRTIQNVSTADQNIIKNWFRGTQDPGTFATTYNSLSNADSQQLMLLLFKNQDSYQDSGFVLRQRIVGLLAAPSFSSLVVGPAFANVIFLQTDLLPGGAFDLRMDQATVDFLESIPVPTGQTNYTWGWLCQAPTQTVIPGGKVEFRQEWRLNLWSNYLYDLAVT